MTIQSGVPQRLPTESAKAYAAFQIYVFLPVHERSIGNAFRSRTNSGSIQDQTRIEGRYCSQWRLWAAKYEWVSRAAVYDQYLFEQDQQRWEERRRRKKESEWEQAEAFRHIISDALPHARQFIRRKTAFVRGGDGQPDREIITVEFDIAALATVFEKIGRVQNLILGEATDHVLLSGAALDAYIARQLERLAHGAETGIRGLLVENTDAAEDG